MHTYINQGLTFVSGYLTFQVLLNTIQPHLLAEKLLKVKISAPTILWVLDYLISRLQYVKLGRSVTSRTICTNTGAPQGIVLSPFLLSLYIADYKNVHKSCPITKFANDTGLTGQITDDDGSCYRQEIDRFVDWCDQNY